MRILIALFITGGSMGLSILGMRIFSQIHCRQAVWLHDFEKITNKVIQHSALKLSSCQFEGNFHLEMDLGEEL